MLYKLKLKTANFKRTGYMQDRPARSVCFDYSQDSGNRFNSRPMEIIIYFWKQKLAICVGDEFD